MTKEEVSEYLKSLAEKYENADFLLSDPSKYLRRYEKLSDREVCAFTAAMLSFGNRKIFLPKIEKLCELAGSSFAAWILKGDYRKDLLPEYGNPEEKFYRFYSYKDMYDFFDELRQILTISGSFGTFLRQSIEYGYTEMPLDIMISQCFPNSKIVSKGKNSANKRIHMFLRWMVRRNSPVDLGIWTFVKPADLIIPMDTHVLSQSIKLGLLPENAKADRKNAVLLTARLKEIWPDDPCKGDFALFGLGVDNTKEQKL